MHGVYLALDWSDKKPDSPTTPPFVFVSIFPPSAFRRLVSFVVLVEVSWVFQNKTVNWRLEGGFGR